MADRRVRCTSKDSDNDITGLGNNDSDWKWVSKNAAILEIDGGIHTYYVKDSNGRSDVETVPMASGGKYLRTDPNGECSDNLGSLPSC